MTEYSTASRNVLLGQILLTSRSIVFPLAVIPDCRIGQSRTMALMWSLRWYSNGR